MNIKLGFLPGFFYKLYLILYKNNIFIYNIFCNSFVLLYFCLISMIN